MTFPARNNPFSISQSAAQSLIQAKSDWDLVCKFLHWDGMFNGLLTSAEKRFFRTFADGFGSLRGMNGGMYEDMLWDWSHVRDSSEEATGAMADALRAWVKHYTK